MMLQDVLDGPWRGVPAGLWVLAVLAAIALVAVLVIRARMAAVGRSIRTLEDDLRETVRAVREQGDIPARLSLALEHRADGTPGDPLPGTLEHEQLLRWMASGQQLVDLVRRALRDHERLQREASASKRECERLRRELVRLQAECDRLVRERRQFAHALATFVHEAGPRALLDPTTPPPGPRSTDEPLAH